MPNEQLRSARERTSSPSRPGYSMTRRELADAVHAWLLDRQIDRPIDETYIGKLERGTVRWPNKDYRVALRSILDAADDAALGFAPPRADARPLVVEPELVVEPWELIDALTRSSIGHRTLDHLEVSVSGCAERYPAEGPRQLGPSIHRQLGRIRTALDHPQPLAVRQRLTRLLGYLSVLAANVAADLGDAIGAAGFYDVADQAALEAGDDGVRAWANANRAIASFAAGDHADAGVLLAGATDHGRHAVPRRRAWIAALLARSQAQAGDRTAALRALDESRGLLDQVDDPPGGTDFFDDTRLAGLRGSTLLALGDVAEAENLIRSAMSGRSSSDLKGRALLGLELAQCRILDREYDEAARLALESLAMASTTIVGPIVTKARGIAGALSAAGAASAAAPVLGELQAASQSLGEPS